MKLAVVIVAVLAAREARADNELSFDGRIASEWVFLEGDGPPADLSGYCFALGAAYALGPRVSLGAALEAAIYTERSDRLPDGGSAHSLAPFVELHIDTNPTGPLSARIDLATGFRWLRLPLASGPTDSFRMWEPIVVRAGPAWRTSRGTQIAVLFGFGVGWKVSSGRDGACAVTGSCADSLFDSDTQSSAHFTADFALAVRGWP